MGWGPYTWGVIRMSAGFFFLFMAFNTAQNLESTLVTDNTLVNASLAALYGVFTFMTIFAPAIVSLLGPIPSMVLGAIPYVLLVFANIVPSYYTFLPTFSGVGAGAAILWTAQGMYLSRCAIAQAAMTGEPVEQVTSSLNALFWTAFQFNGALGLVIASTIFVSVSDYQNAVKYLFIVFGALGGVGVFILSTVPRLSAALPSTDAVGSDASALLARSAGSTNDDSDAAKKGAAPRVSLIATLRLLARSRALQLLVPIIFYNGASLGFNGAMFPLAYADKDADSNGNGGVTRLFDHKLVGFVGATFYLCNSLFSYAWGFTVARFGRRPLFVLTAVTHVVYFLAVFGFLRGIPGIGHGSVPAYVSVFACAILFAAGDSVLESQVPAIIQSPTFFPDEADRDAAVSNLRLWQSLGFTVQFAIGIVAPNDVYVQLYVVAPLLVLSLACLWLCDAYVQPVDTSGKAAYAPVPQSAHSDDDRA